MNKRRSKYSKLYEFLKTHSKPITLSYKELEKILGFRPPESAYVYRAWWSNGGHSYSWAWLDAGFKVDKVILGQHVAFKRFDAIPKDSKNKITSDYTTSFTEFKLLHTLFNTIEQKSLQCPVCQSNKAEIAGEKVKLGGQFEDKEFLTRELTVLKCTRCGYYMFFDKMAKFTTKE